MKLAVEDIARVIGAPTRLTGDVSSYSIDSRTAAEGDLFVALRGENHDAHDYVSGVLDKGAAAAIVDRDLGSDPRLMRVPDSLQA
ncbi:MAG TPA: Mur ligase domain-containing protein [Bryobacteraceae bacterium]|nr:Mur ligase domain-containing protein [Bryobacteraceae bacterium]